MISTSKLRKMRFSLLSHLLLCTKTHKGGSCLPHAKFSLQYLKFSLRYTMGNMFGMFSFAFCIIRTLKCEVVNSLKFKLAGIPIRLIKYLGIPILFRAHAPCMCTHDAHANHDVTRFAYYANHVTMTSPVFALTIELFGFMNNINNSTFCTQHSCDCSVKGLKFIG